LKRKVEADPGWLLAVQLCLRWHQSGGMND
jgi:hypothetical protein